MAELKVIYRNLYEQREDTVASSLTIAEFLERVEWPIKAAQLNGEVLHEDKFDKTFDDYKCKTLCYLGECVKCGSAYTNMPHRDLGYELQFNKYRSYDMYTIERVGAESDIVWVDEETGRCEYDDLRCHANIVLAVFKTLNEAISNIKKYTGDNWFGLCIRGHNYGEDDIQDPDSQFDMFVDIEFVSSDGRPACQTVGAYINYKVSDVLLYAGIDIEEWCYVVVDGEKFTCGSMLKTLEDFGADKNSNVTIINRSAATTDADWERIREGRFWMQ